MLEIHLPYPPSVNHYWIRNRNGSMRFSPAAIKFQAAVRAIILPARLETLTGKLACHVEVFPPDNAKRDLDNVQKAIFDALQYCEVFRDDSQIAWILIERAEVRAGGAIIVRLVDRAKVSSDPIVKLMEAE